MPLTELPFATGFYKNRSLPVAAQECVNLYPSIPDGPALSQEVLFGTPGLHELATSGTDKQDNRGAHVKDGIPYFVNGNTLYSIDRTITDDVESFSVTSLGTITGSKTDRVSMADNGTQLLILDPGGDGFIFDESAGTPFQQITDSDFTANGNPQIVVYVDGFFLLTTDSKKFIVSALNDGLAYDALDFGTAEADPDDIVTAVVHNNQVFIGGSETIEVFQNVGGAGFPFQRVQGFVMPSGVFSAFSMIQAANTFFFIGGGVNESPSVRVFNGSGTDPVSSDGIDAILGAFSDTEISESFAWSYSQAGARFIGFTFPSTTLVFDTDAGRWHERKSQITDNNGTRNLRWRVNSMVTGYGRVLCGDSEDGRIGELSLDFFDEYDGEIISRFATVAYSNTSNPLTFPSLELTMESGVGNADVTDPKIRLAFSRDGKTFSSEITRSIGKIGEYFHRVIWRRLGRFPRFAVFRFTMSDRVKKVIIKLEANVIGGNI